MRIAHATPFAGHLGRERHCKDYCSAFTGQGYFRILLTIAGTVQFVRGQGPREPGEHP